MPVGIEHAPLDPESYRLSTPDSIVFPFIVCAPLFPKKLMEYLS